MNHITITGRATKVGDLHFTKFSGGSMHIHIKDDTEAHGDVWFIVRVLGKLAESVCGKIRNGEMVTVFGRIQENLVDGSPAIMIMAKDVIPHGNSAAGGE
jgi:single-stranded DNA-binding protein